jgi:hypothetical protein
MRTPAIPTGQQIRQARWARSWTQDELIAAIHAAGYPKRLRDGVPQQMRQNTLSSIENGRPIPPKMLYPLLRALPELAVEPEELAKAG